MTRTGLALGLFTAAAALSAGPPVAAPPEELVRRGNDAFERGDADAADRLYAVAQERTDDPGLVVFNRAAVLFGRGEFREAEVHYLRALADAAVPSDRRVKALFNRGVCLLKRNGDAALYRSAIASFEQCLEASSADPALVADARHNLEIAKVLWNQARLREKTRPKANDPPPEEHFPELPPAPPRGRDAGDDGTDPGGRPDPSGTPEQVAGQGPKDQTPRPTDRQSPGSGQLPVVQDSETLQSLSPEDTRALLRRAADRLDKDRKTTAQLLAGPERTNVRDW